MCGRLATLLPIEAMAQLFSAMPSNNLPFSPNYNICPTDDLAVVVSDEGRRLMSMRWGFVPHWYKAVSDGPLLINARAEGIAEKPAFREACRVRRCLIPATGFYEWTKTAEGTRLPWYFERSDQTPVVFAGIWQGWDKGDAPVSSCAIVTTAANDAISGIHHRMPLVLEPNDWSLWLGEAGKGAAGLMVPAPNDALRFHRVGVQVNSNRASGPELIEPFEE